MNWLKMFALLSIIALLLFAGTGTKAQGPAPELGSIAVTNLSGANASVTLTLPAAGAGLFHYITAIKAVRTCTSAITGTAVLAYTSTNLPGTLAWSSGNACAVGSTNQDIDIEFERPLKSSVVNTASTIVAPAAGAAGIIRLTAYYYTAQ